MPYFQILATWSPDSSKLVSHFTKDQGVNLQFLYEAHVVNNCMHFIKASMDDKSLIVIEFRMKKCTF